MMRILFMGTPKFAAVSLERLYTEGYDVCGVFTQPDRPRNRGMKLSFSPVKEVALRHSSAVYQPSGLRDAETLNQIAGLWPDIIVVAAYGQLIPREILSCPKYGCVNVHGSILPRYRGAAPVQWAVINGESETGVTIMQMNEGLDTGDIIEVEKTAIDKSETAEQLLERLAHIGADLLVRTLRTIENGTAVRTPQNDGEATYAPRLTREHSPIGWNRSPEAIVNQIRGLIPWPVASAEIGNRNLNIYSAYVTDNKTGNLPGGIVAAEGQGIEVACAGGGTVMVTEVQEKGGRRMSAADYLRGHKIEY